MGTYRKRYNEKARTGMMAKNEKLRRARQKRFLAQPDGGEDANEQDQEPKEFDPNAELLLPMTEEEKSERKRKMREELRPKEESSYSKRRKKNLEKYIVCTFLDTNTFWYFTEILTII